MISKIKEKIKGNKRLSEFTIWMISSRYGSRPRIWVRLLLNPLLSKRGKGSKIRFSVRQDIFPFNAFHLGQHSYIEDFCTINNGVGDLIIGDYSRIGVGCTVIAPVIIGNHVHIAQNVVISGLNHNYEDVDRTIESQGVSKALIRIEDDVWVGGNSVITAGVTIGTHSVLAGGSVLTKSMPPYTVWGGVPAKMIKRFNFENREWERV